MICLQILPRFFNHKDTDGSFLVGRAIRFSLSKKVANGGLF